MAKSGSLTTSSYDGRHYKLSWTAAQNVANNKSTISWTLEAVGGDDSWYAERTVKVVIAGSTRFSKTDRVQRYTGTVASGSFDLTHDSAGNKSFSASVEAAVYYSAVNCTGSKSFTLDTIPRQATLTSAPNFTDEDNPVIKYNNPAGNSVTSLQACIATVDGKSTYVQYRDIPKTESSYTFEFTDAERKLFRDATANSKSLDVKFYIKTVIGETTSYSSIQKTLSIVNANPTLSPEVFISTDSDTYKLTGSTTKFIRYYTWPSYKFNAQAKKSAQIQETKIKCGDLISYYDNDRLEGAMTSKDVVFTVTDTRGNVATKTVTTDMVEYIRLTCNIDYTINAFGDVSGTIHGNYFFGSFGAVSNTLQVGYRYKEIDGDYGAWTYLTPTKDKNSNTYSADFNMTVDYQKSYIFQAWAGDAFYEYNLNNGVFSTESSVQATPIFDWNQYDFNFNVPVTINGDLTVTGAIEGGADSVIESGYSSMGSNGNWYWRKWKSGRADCYGCRNYGNMAVTTTWGVLYRSEVFEQSLPSGLFAGRPDVIDISVISSNFGAWIAKHETEAPSATSTGSFIVVRPANATLSQVYIGFNVIGYWQ